MSLPPDKDYLKLFEILRCFPEGATYCGGKSRHNEVVESDFPVESSPLFVYRARHETTVFYPSKGRLIPTTIDDISFKKGNLTVGCLQDSVVDNMEELFTVETRINFLGGIDFRTKGSLIAVPADVYSNAVRTFPRRTTDILRLSIELIDPSTHARTLTFDVQGYKKKDVNSYESF